MRIRTILTLSALMLSIFVPYSGVHAQEKIRFGVLPVLQALPLFVAQDKKLFEKNGLQVELIPFNTATEKDVALTTGNIDGYFGDLLTPIVLQANRHNVKIVATSYDTRKDKRMFAVLGKPKCEYKSVSDLAGIPVAVSSNSVIDFVTERLLTGNGVPQDKVATVEAKNIGLRMQMLLSGQVEAATLPEPLVTAAVGKGATVLADDSKLGESQTVLVFSAGYLDKKPAAVKAFLKAQNEASKLINENPDSARSTMVEHVRLPEHLKAGYPVPRFPELAAPEKDNVQTIVQWLTRKGVISESLTYEQVVNASYLP